MSMLVKVDLMLIEALRVLFQAVTVLVEAVREGIVLQGCFHKLFIQVSKIGPRTSREGVTADRRILSNALYFE